MAILKSIKILKLLSILIFVQLLSCSSYATAYEEDFNGKVVDSVTGEPIEGVVILATWYRKYPTVAGSMSKFFDATETITDNNGEFKINGQGIDLFGNRAPMDLMIYKAGYNYENTSIDSFKYQTETVRLEGEKVIITLTKLTMKERKIQGSPSRPNIPMEKMKLMTEEISKERLERGLDSL